VMESGRIVEHGTHEQLLAARGAYHRLYAAQFRGASDEVEAAEPEPSGVPTAAS
jgi:ATP-binding cassette subfamily B multidrug efflux pump